MASLQKDVGVAKAHLVALARQRDALQHLRQHPEDRGWLLGLLAASREETSPEAIEEAIQKAARTRYGAEHDIRVRIDPKTGEVLEQLDMPQGIFISGLEIGGDTF